MLAGGAIHHVAGTVLEAADKHRIADKQTGDLPMRFVSDLAVDWTLETVDRQRLRRLIAFIAWLERHVQPDRTQAANNEGRRMERDTGKGRVRFSG